MWNLFLSYAKKTYAIVALYDAISALVGWTGVNCTMDKDECNVTNTNSTGPCEHGICVNTPGLYHCDCQGSGYNGKCFI